MMPTPETTASDPAGCAGPGSIAAWAACRPYQPGKRKQPVLRLLSRRFAYVRLTGEKRAEWSIGVPAGRRFTGGERGVRRIIAGESPAPLRCQGQATGAPGKVRSCRGGSTPGGRIPTLPPMHPTQPLVIAGRTFRSRLILGTGKFPSPEAMRDALVASGTELVKVALRRADLSGKKDPFANILEFIDPAKYLLLPNTSGAMNAEEAVRLARLAHAAGLPKWVKLEIHPDPRYLLPDPIETLAAAQILVREGFTVLPYINADPVLAKRLQEVGVATVMPLGAPIGSNRGLQTRDQLRIIIEQATVPVVVDAGLGAPSHAAEALELGADAVLVNTAIAVAEDPIRMAAAFRMAVEAGRLAWEAGVPAVRGTASATSPLTGFLD